jgi:hypothetical protein
VVRRKDLFTLPPAFFGTGTGWVKLHHDPSGACKHADLLQAGKSFVFTTFGVDVYEIDHSWSACVEVAHGLEEYRLRFSTGERAGRILADAAYTFVSLHSDAALVNRDRVRSTEPPPQLLRKVLNRLEDVDAAAVAPQKSI